MKRIVQSMMFFSFAATLLMSLGCQDDRQKANELRRRRQATASTVDQDDLRDAWSFLGQLAEADQAAAADRVAFHLNAWVDKEQPDPKWTVPTGLLETLKPYQRDRCKSMAERRFSAQDLDHLRLNYVLNHIAEWATEGEVDDVLLKKWITASSKEMTADQQRDLTTAARLFDWSVRNVMLEPFELPSDGPRPSGLPYGLSFQAPGYRQTPFETVWRGSGDSLQRARVFIQLCRQANIDACMIAFVGDVQQRTPWLCGARIGDDLYLFEPQLGLPVPGLGEEGIATLLQAQEDATILRRLSVTGWFEYPVKKDDISQCQALIDATPEAMSWRMTALEKALTGDLRLRLTIDVEELPKRLNACRGIAGTALWTPAIDAQIYHEAITEAIRNDASLQIVDQLAWGMLKFGSPLSKARWQHLVGNFEPQDTKQGAFQAYQTSRMTEADIDSLATNVDLQIAHAIQRRANDTPEQHAFKIQLTQKILRSAKLSASYYLGLALFDRQRYDSAETWLNERYLESGGETAAQAPGAQYALARSLEHLGKSEESIEIYKTASGAQQHGNRLRARLIDQ